MSLNKIMIVGEAWGEEEELSGEPFVGPSGKLLNQLLAEAGIARKECYVTNVFNIRPRPKNDVENLCGPKAEAIRGLPAIRSGKYISQAYDPEVVRLYREVQLEQPNLILALGASAAWALLSTSGIKKVRGAPSGLHGRALAEVGTSFKVLPTYHPAAILRDWSLRAVTVMDLLKARREAEYPEIRRPKREIWIEPDLQDLQNFEDWYIVPADSLSIDIETAGEQITCVGFAPSHNRSIVVPFVDPMKKSGNYWEYAWQEVKAWDFVRRWCSLPKRIVGQNFNYDMHRLWRSMGIPVPHATDDTMLMHHSLQPELEKGLAFTASIYTDELAWKFMRNRSHDKGDKQEDTN